jgi:hypothetical protein
MRKCAIHQPNLVPWLPYFEKMRSVDVFVIMTHAQFSKGGHLNRFNHDNQWYTMSVNHGIEPLMQKRYVNYESDWRKIIDRLPQFASIFADLAVVPSANLVAMNISIIMRLRMLLGIETEIVMDKKSCARSTERLVEICREVGADSYLAGASGKAYLDLSKFEDAGIAVEFQDLSGIRKISSLQAIAEARCA